jgi:hypothetical protein
LLQRTKRQTLEESYSQWVSSDNTISPDFCKAILRVMEKVNQTFAETIISHAHLLLFTTESNDTEWYVDTIANADEYNIEYKMPKCRLPRFSLHIKNKVHLVQVGLWFDMPVHHKQFRISCCFRQRR